jgi:hypothetical protein
MYIAKLNDGPKRVKKTFSMIFERFFKWCDGGGENGITSKRIFEDEVFFKTQYKCRYSYTYEHSPYEHMHAHPSPMSTSED